MHKIKFMNVALLVCLFVQCSAMNSGGSAGSAAPANQLGEPVLNRAQQAQFKKDWYEKRSKEQIDRDAFWQEQFGQNSKAKDMPKALQKHLVQNFLLPMSKAESARKKYKFYLPMAVKGLTPARIEGVEESLKKHHAQFKSEYLKKHGKEPNSLTPTIIAYANPHGELREIIGEPASNVGALANYPSGSIRVVDAGIDARDRHAIGNAVAAIYSNGSIEWTIDPADHAKIAALSADQKVATEHLYKKALQADREPGVQLGRQRVVSDRYNQVFNGNINAIENFGRSVQTRQTKLWTQVGRGIVFAGSLLCMWLGYRVFFKNKSYDWNKTHHGLIGIVGLSYIAAHFITATKMLIAGLMNLR
jgi:hypothetical protein